MATTAALEVLRTADGTPLRLKVRRATRLGRLRAFALVLPLLAFVVITFVAPIADMVLRSVSNPPTEKLMPATVAALEAWDGGGIPDEPVFAALARELVAREADRTLGAIAARLNYEIAGARTLVFKTARRLQRIESGPFKEAILAIDNGWSDTLLWATLKRIARPFTFSYYLQALDMRYDAEGDILAQPAHQQIYVMLFVRTLWVSLLITLLCLLLGYPIAYLMSALPLRYANLLMIMVLLPFWTSLLVRTTSWIALLQSGGVINDTLVAIGVISEEGRIQMIYNMAGTVIAMTHILLPFMALPLYSVMRTISPSHVRAAQSLGAGPLRTFWRIYAPQTVPGIGAGSLLVFILAIGYYITPALVGGRTGQLISNFIAYHMQQSLNWGLGAALGGLLLAGVLVLYWLYDRLVGIDNMKLG